jgi:hypothetical protein
LARPTKLFLDYFSHDTDSVNDEKMELFRSAYGNDGYAFYFIILERIYKNEGAVLDLSKNIFVIGLAKKLMITIEKFNEMLEVAFELNMFNRELFDQKKLLTSNGIQKRYEEVMKQRKMWNKKKKTNDDYEFSNEKTNDDYEFSNEKTVGKTTQRKGNMKGKEIENKLEEKEIVYSDMVNDLTVLLCNKLRENNEKAKLPSDLKKWNSAIDALNRLDGYSFEQIESVLIWSQQNHFWKTNILSATKLREKFAQLLLNMQEEERKATDNAQYKGYGKRFVRTNSNDSKHDNDEGYASDLGGFTVEDAIKLVQARGY